ncbi:MAG: hypothetical protein CVU97_03085 [Firmicutes bacterium HGW-Firmicutes-21]|nr:MAG: hypothetical protein CVU97_03085 [Firmicutes bacterium HGW-Firmicutes-21]
MSRAFIKDCLRQVKTTIHRFAAILVISALGVAFFAGLRTTGEDMRITANDYFNKYNFMDIQLVSPYGFNDDDLEAVRDAPGVKEATAAYTLDALAKSKDSSLTVRLHSFDENARINLPRLTEGRLPQKSGECLVDPKFIEMRDCVVGDTVSVSSGTDTPIEDSLVTDTYIIVGVADYPLYISHERGANNVGSGRTDAYILVPCDDFKIPVFTSINIIVENSNNTIRFDDGYKNILKPVGDNLRIIGNERSLTEYNKHFSRLQGIIDLSQNEAEKQAALAQQRLLTPAEWHILDINTNFGFVGYRQDTERMDALSLVIPLMFFLIAILVTMTSMTRLVESDRSLIGTLKALGYANRTIAMRYLLYAVAASLIGSIFGLIVGYNLFPRVVYNAYSIMYTLPPIQIIYSNFYSAVSVAAAVLCSALPAYLVCYKSMRASAAELMRPITPKIGKRTLIERITPLWKRFNFSQKVAFRNLFRYKKRLIMTLIGVAGCTALMFTGFALQDSITVIVHKQYSELHLYDMQVYFTNGNGSAESIFTENNLIKNHTLILSDTCDIFNDNQKTSVNIIVPKSADEFDAYINLRNRTSKSSLTLDDNGVIVTEKLALLYDLSVGDEFSVVSSDGAVILLTVSGITENYLVHYIYLTHEVFEEKFGKRFLPNSALISTISDTDKNALAESLLSHPEVNSITMSEYLEENFSKMTDALNYVVLVLIASSATLVCVVLFSLNTINFEERKRELATIKVLGFFDRELAAYMYRENAVLTIIGTVFGLGLGVLLQRYIITTMEVDLVMFSREIFFASYLYSAVLTIAFAVVVNLIMLKFIARIDVVTSMKSVE